jgi:hypothetical protein
MDILTLNFVLFVCCPVVVILGIILYGLLSDTSDNHIKVLSDSTSSGDDDNR